MNLAKLDPDWQVAELHGIATYPGIIDPNRQPGENVFCPCCLNTIQKQKAPLCSNSKQLEFLGFGFPLFYVFLKYCIILLLVTLCSYNAIELEWAIEGSHSVCQQEQLGCTSFLVKLAAITHNIYNAEVLVRIFSFSLQLGVLVYFRDLINKTRNYYDERTCSLSDYAIMLEGLPKKMGARRNLLKFLDRAFQKPYTIHDITFLPAFQEFYEMEELVALTINKMKKAMGKGEQGKEQLQKLELELARLEGKLEDYCQKQLTSEQNDEIITDKLIFCCQNENQKNQILQNFANCPEDTIRQLFEIPPEQPCKINAEEAPQPKEINWENINYPAQKSQLRVIGGWILTIFFLGGVTGAFFYLLTFKSHLIQESHDDHTMGYALAYVGIFFVILFNKFIMSYVLHHITVFQLHRTTDEQEFHFALKYSVGLFFTTALMTLAVEDLKNHNFFSEPYGVIEEEGVMFFMNAFFVPLIWLINPWQIHVAIRRYLNYGRKDMTQKQANKIMENMQYNMGKKYAEVLEIMWFSYLYSSILPLGMFLSVIGLGLYYWVDKYNLLRRSSVNTSVAGSLSNYAMKLLDITLIVKPLGEILFDIQLRQSYCISSFVMVGISLIYLIIPIDRILQMVHPQKFNVEEKHYLDVKQTFKYTYQNLHPIYSQRKENQQKLLQAFKYIDSLFDNNTLQNLKIKPVSNEAKLEDTTGSANPLKNTANVLQILFTKSAKHIQQQNQKDNKSNQYSVMPTLDPNLQKSVKHPRKAKK